MHALLGREEASPSPVYGARLLSGFRLIPVAGSNPAASAIGISQEIHGQTEPGSGSVCLSNSGSASLAPVGSPRDVGVACVTSVISRQNDFIRKYYGAFWPIRQ